MRYTVAQTPKSYLYSIILEIPGERVMNEAETLTIENSILDAISNPDCDHRYFQVTSLNIQNQIMSRSGSVIVLELNVNTTVISQKFYFKTRVAINECFERKKSDIKLEYDKSFGSVVSTSDGGAEAVETVRNSNVTMISVLVCGSAFLGIMFYGVCLVQKRKQKRRKFADITNQSVIGMNEQKENSKDCHSLHEDDYNASDLHKELDDIEKMLSTALSGETHRIEPVDTEDNDEDDSEDENRKRQPGGKLIEEETHMSSSSTNTHLTSTDSREVNNRGFSTAKIEKNSIEPTATKEPLKSNTLGITVSLS